MTRRIIYYGGLPKYEPEVIRFLTAISVPNNSTLYYPSTAYEIMGSEIWEALNTCVEGMKTALGLTLKSDNLSTKFKYIYPRIGGTSTAHRYNLVTGTADGTYNGGFTHDATGSVGNGSTGYFDTGFQFSISNFAQNSLSFGVYIKNAISENTVDFGVFSGGVCDALMYSRGAAGNMLSRLGSNSGNIANANTTSLGLKVLSRTASNQYKVYEDGSLLATNTDTSTLNNTTYNMLEFAGSSAGSPVQYSNHKHTWFWGGIGFGATEIGNIYTALNTFETTLNR